MKRPIGSNADEWQLFLREYLGDPSPRLNDFAFIAVQIAEAIDAAALTAALSDQVVVAKDDDAHAWHMKPTTIPDEMFKRPTFVADALRKMVANCVSLHAAGSSLYTDGERKAMLAAAEHIETFVAAAPASTSGEVVK